MPDQQVDKIILTVDAPNGDKLAIVTLTGGGLAITRNGQLIPEHRWEVHEMQECTASLARLAGLSRDDFDRR
ncbi:MAG: hypothetical protein JWN40_5820 [Phycisphaerales bacterium]|nr:hypothetical protein [Phycisphaerales bacterium]